MNVPHACLSVLASPPPKKKPCVLVHTLVATIQTVSWMPVTLEDSDSKMNIKKSYLAVPLKRDRFIRVAPASLKICNVSWFLSCQVSRC